MEITKEKLKEVKNDPMMYFLADLFGIDLNKVINDLEKEVESRTNETKKESVKSDLHSVSDEEADVILKRIKNFFDKLVENGDAKVNVENGQPHYSVKSDDKFTEANSSDTLLEENESDESDESDEFDESDQNNDFCESNSSFSMSKEELEEFVKDYTKLDNTIRKLNHTYGIDLNSNSDSIYSQYNNIIWNLIKCIFGEDNREDIADFIFGDSNFDTVSDLYEESV